MRTPRYRIFGWSWLGILNFFVLQWLFFRLEGITLPLEFDKNRKVIFRMKLGLLFIVLPLTGWWSDYIFPFGERRVDIFIPEKRS